MLRWYFQIFCIQVCFWEFLLNSHWANTSVCVERAAAPCTANAFNGACCWRHTCLLVWYYHLPAVLNFIWIGMKRSGKGMCFQTYQSSSSLFLLLLLLPYSNFRHALRLDILFYTSALVSACWDLTCFESVREKVYRIPPKDMHAGGREHQSAMWCLMHWIFVDMTSSCQMFSIWGKFMRYK